MFLQTFDLYLHGNLSFCARYVRNMIRYDTFVQKRNYRSPAFPIFAISRLCRYFCLKATSRNKLFTYTVYTNDKGDKLEQRESSD